MKRLLLGLGAVGVLVAGPACAARMVDAETQHYLTRANAKAAAMLAAARIEPGQVPVSVRARVDTNGALIALDVVRTSGSADTDRAVAGVLRNLVRSDAPLGLINGAVTLNVGRANLVQATGH